MTDSAPQAETGSFRDRQGRIYVQPDAVFRGLSSQAWSEWELLSNTKFFKKALESGSIVKTEADDSLTVDTADLPQPWHAYLKHERLSFVTYPYEWPFDMLKDAALLQLELLEQAVAEGMILKDSTPYNVVYRGAQPVFIDIPSSKS